MKKRVTIDRFLKDIGYTPKFKGRDFDGVIIVEFPETESDIPCLEFGVNPHDWTNGKFGQYLYFESIDKVKYHEGDVIPFNSNLRKYVIDTVLTPENEKDLALRARSALDEIYGKSSHHADVSERL